MSERSLSDWLSDAGNTLDDRGLEYGDPRHNLLRIYKIARQLGVQFRDPSDVALVFIATKLSRMVESPEREDSYLDLIGYSTILSFSDSVHQKIGTTLSLTRNHNQHQWCDYCKMRWGQMKDGTWHHKAQVPAVWKVQSETPTRRMQVRFYCQPCANEAQN
jgi:hypothetical protein